MWEAPNNETDFQMFQSLVDTLFKDIVIKPQQLQALNPLKLSIAVTFCITLIESVF